jgi:hypothetical protein
MSRKLMLASLALAVVVVAPGLAPADSGMTKGLTVGLNLASASGSDSTPPAGVTKSMRAGVAGGVFVGIGAGPLTIQPEVLYSMKGAQYKGTILGVAWTDTRQLSYLDIPVLVKYDIAPAPTKISIFVGPSLGILLSAQDKVEAAGFSGTTDIKSSMNTTDIGVLVGAGVTLAGGLSIDARYQMGLSSLAKVPSGVTAPKVYNSVIAVMLGFAL